MRCWAIRTDKDNKKLIWEELQRGKLRQGWGYDESQDLKSISRKLESGSTLTLMEEHAWRNRRMLDTEGENNIKKGDLIFLPNLPEQSRFTIVRVSGPYSFERIKLTKDQMKHGFEEDYGHILPVDVSPGYASLDYGDVRVHAELRRSLRCQSRLWSLGDYEENVVELYEKIRSGKIKDEVFSPERVLEMVYGEAVSDLKEKIKMKFDDALKRHFGGALFEVPVKVLLQKMYPDAAVERTGGSGEHGVDIEVIWEDPLSGCYPHSSALAWNMIVQVKSWRGMAEDVEPKENPIDQIVHGYKHRKGQGIKAGLIVTLCDEESSGFSDHLRRAIEEIGIPITHICKKELLEYFMRFLPEGVLA